MAGAAIGFVEEDEEQEILRQIEELQLKLSRKKGCSRWFVTNNYIFEREWNWKMYVYAVKSVFKWHES